MKILSHFVLYFKSLTRSCQSHWRLNYNSNLSFQKDILSTYTYSTMSCSLVSIYSAYLYKCSIVRNTKAGVIPTQRLITQIM